MIAALAGSGGAGAAIDFWTRRIPNWLTVGIATLGVALAASDLSPLSVPAALGGFVVGLILMLPGHVIGVTGAGDVKLFAAAGTMLGPTRMASAFVFTAIAGGALALAIALHRRRLTETLEGTAMLVRTGGANVAEIENPLANNRFAYAPAIALGVLAAALGF